MSIAIGYNSELGGPQTRFIIREMDNNALEMRKIAIFYVYNRSNQLTNFCAPCVLIQHIRTRIVPMLYPDMHRYEAKRGSLWSRQEREMYITMVLEIVWII